MNEDMKMIVEKLGKMNKKMDEILESFRDVKRALTLLESAAEEGIKTDIDSIFGKMFQSMSKEE